MLLEFNTFFQFPNSVFAEIGSPFSLKTNSDSFFTLDNIVTSLSGKSTLRIEFCVFGVLYIVSNFLFPSLSKTYTFFTDSFTSKYFSTKFKIDELTKTSTSAIFIPTRRCFYFRQIQMKEKENEKNNQWNQKLLQRSKKRN